MFIHYWNEKSMVLVEWYIGQSLELAGLYLFIPQTLKTKQIDVYSRTIEFNKYQEI